jgi:hypothetical protein
MWFHITWENESEGYDQHGTKWINKNNPQCTDERVVNIALDTYNSVMALNKESKMEKEILYIIEAVSVNFLIPKKRGTGYLKTPVGHYSNELASKIEKEFPYDVCGLDGYLCVDTGATWGKNYDKLIKLISSHYGLPIKTISRNRWYNLLQKK